MGVTLHSTEYYRVFPPGPVWAKSNRWAKRQPVWAKTNQLAARTATSRGISASLPAVYSAFLLLERERGAAQQLSAQP